MTQIVITVIIFTLILFVNISMEDEVNSATIHLYKIEGKVQVTDTPVAEWAPSAKVIVDGGRFIGFIKQDGSFVISNVPPGSYLVEVSSPSYIFEPARVDISSKTGKMRARKSDLLRPTAVTALPYPLKFKVTDQAKFFAKREEWSLVSTLMNPMVQYIVYEILAQWVYFQVLMMLAPVLLMLVIPRMMKNMDPQSQKVSCFNTVHVNS